MADQYDPPESSIADMLDRFTPRQLAIAYLRASHRAKQAELALKVGEDIDRALASVMSDDVRGGISHLDRANRRMKGGKP